MKKLLVIGALAVVVLTGCVEPTPATSNTTNLQSQTNQLIENQTKLTNSVEMPKLTTSQERLNIKRRAELFDNENKISYIYLVNYGKVMAFYTVKGKVSSLKSYLSPQEILVDYKGRPCSAEPNVCELGYGESRSGAAYSIQAPDIDGSYGDNADGIFFFTTEGAYVEWVGDYMMSDQPLKLSTPPELVREIK